MGVFLKFFNLPKLLIVRLYPAAGLAAAMRDSESKEFREFS